MKIKPVITDRICTKHTSFDINLQLDNNITFICGESGTGKSAMFSILEEAAIEDRRIRCFNFQDSNRAYKSSIKQSRGKLFVIDNADILLDDTMRNYIALDCNNQYIIIGRNPTGLLLEMDEIYELRNETIDGITFFTVEKSLT